MANALLKLTLVAGLIAAASAGIGDNPFDLKTLTGLISGIGHMIEHPLNTIEIPSQLIMGQWFQVYKAAVNFDLYKTQIYCPVAYFKPNTIMGEDGFSIEEAFRVDSKNGPIETYKRDLNKVGAGKYWMYTEEYFYPRQFYIINAGPKFDNDTLIEEADVQYFIVTDASRMSLSVYCREPFKFFQHYNKEVAKYLEEAGFGGKVAFNSPRPIYQGPDCEWPTEKEVFARRVLKNHENAKRAESTNGTSPELLKNVLQNPQKALQEILTMH
uniref:Lipocln_cytosolic_FA-bd_dom domain-containing protein n=1 Tax=Panagrellus redivivus TaxID=6233 RepID=A0A7E4VR29_PANRE